MPVRRGVTLGAALLILGATATLSIYRVATGPASSWVIDNAGMVPTSSRLTGAAVIGQLAALVWLAAGKLPVWHRAVLTVATTGLATAAGLQLDLPVRAAALGIGGICHAAAYGWLLSRFAASLQPGREPVVTGFARRIRPTMPDDVVRYTREVTRAWCIFFTAQIAASAALLVMAPLAAWSSFGSLWNLPLVVAMMLAEFGCRLLIFRRQPRTSLAATLAGLRHFRGASGGAP